MISFKVTSIKAVSGIIFSVIGISVLTMSLLTATAQATSGKCVAQNLVVSTKTRAALKAAHAKVDNVYKDKGPYRIFYGKCGQNYYAVATFSDPKLKEMDQPERFRKVPGKKWKDLGDAGYDIYDIPGPLCKAWGFTYDKYGDVWHPW